MKTTLGINGLSKSFLDDDFPEINRCPFCYSDSMVAFVAHEGFKPNDEKGLLIELESVYKLHGNYNKCEKWVTDYCSFAVYICRGCKRGNVLIHEAEDVGEDR